MIFTAVLKDEFINEVKDAKSIADVQKVMYPILKETLEATGFNKYLKNYFQPLIRSLQRDHDNYIEYNVTFTLEILDILKVTFNELKSVDFECYAAAGNLNNTVKTHSELIEIIEDFHQFLREFSDKISLRKYGIYADLYRLKQGRQLDKDIQEIDPDYFFSYDYSPQEVYYYLPRYDAYVVTQQAYGAAVHISDTFVGGVYPYFIEEDGLILPYNKKPSVFVDTEFYKKYQHQEIINHIKSEQFNVLFKDWREFRADKSVSLNYAPFPADLDIAKELTSSSLIVTADRNVDLWRIRDDHFILSDHITKQNIKCKNARDAYEYLYDIS